MSAGQYIEYYDKQKTKEKFMEGWTDLKDKLNNLENYCDTCYYENLENNQEVKELNDNEIKSTFCEKLDQIKHDFLDKNDKLKGMEQALIYQFVEFIKINY